MACSCSTIAPVRYRWLGAVWIGFPMPLRLVACLRHWWAGGSADVRTIIAAFPGCGCIEAWKHRMLRFDPIA